MDQFPHDADPRGATVPKGVRLIHARDAGPFVQLVLSPVIGERHTLSPRQAMALMRELALALGKADPCALTFEQEEEIEQACKDYGVGSND